MKGMIGAYMEGRCDEVVTELFRDPGLSLDQIAASQSVPPLFLNYLDSLMFGSYLDGFKTGCALLAELDDIPHNLGFELDLLKLLAVLVEGGRPEQELVSRLEGDVGTPAFHGLVSACDRKVFTSKHLDCMAGRVAENYRPTLLRRVSFFARVNEFREHKKSYFQSIGDPYPGLHPLIWSAQEKATERIVQALSSCEPHIPLIVADARALDWGVIKSVLEGKRACFFFYDTRVLLHSLELDDLRACLVDPLHLMLVGDQYPNPQLRVQPACRVFTERLQPVFVDDRPMVTAYGDALAAALHNCFVQTSREKREESTAANNLYAIGRRLNEHLTVARLGRSRYPAFREARKSIYWADRYKAAPAAGVDLGPNPPAVLEAVLKDQSPIKPRRKVKNKTKLRRAHVLGQIVDGGHAPTRHLRTLLRHHNPERFEVFIFSSELIVDRWHEYPLSPYISDRSDVRAPQTLQLCGGLGVMVELCEPAAGLEQTARYIAARLAELEIDIVVLHGPDTINYMITRLTDVPARVFFEHGSMPQLPGFDLLVVRNELEAEKKRGFYAAMGSRIEALPFNVDCREGWPANPPPKSDFQVPDDALLMTSVSNSLEARLSTDMCTAVAEILKRCPRAYYMPMGQITENAGTRLTAFFEKAGVADRVRFLGYRANPGNIMRAMDLYLNEFPFGGGLTLLDALAAGCPIIAMHDENGPVQARYAGNYYGVERTVQTGRIEDYVALAVSLLVDDGKRDAWKQAALSRYEEKADLKGYVSRFEALLEETLAT